MIEAGTVEVAVAVSVGVGDGGMAVSVNGASVGIGELVATCMGLGVSVVWQAVIAIKNVLINQRNRILCTRIRLS
jgi:hypothetical protein